MKRCDVSINWFTCNAPEMIVNIIRPNSSPDGSGSIDSPFPLNRPKIGESRAVRMNCPLRFREDSLVNEEDDVTPRKDDIVRSPRILCGELRSLEMTILLGPFADAFLVWRANGLFAEWTRGCSSHDGMLLGESIIARAEMQFIALRIVIKNSPVLEERRAINLWQGIFLQHRFRTDFYNR